MKKLRVLLVDDEIMIREGLMRLFDWEAHDCQVVGEATDGMEVLGKIDSLAPDIAIMDINMGNTRMEERENGDELVSFCTFAPLDDVQPTDLTPWIGFVYTFPEHCGNRYAGKLLDYAECLATVMGKEAVYISTSHTGLYEKYGYKFYTMAKDMGGEDSRVYRKVLHIDGADKDRRTETGGEYKAAIVAAARRGIDPVAYCGFSCLFANLFLTLGIGMAEEIFFRGIICGLWLKHGTIKAMILSSVLFGMSHLLNIAGGAELGETILQICFALVYGMVFALIFAEGHSLLPCVLLHALHDFCSFISGEASAKLEIILGAVQFVVLLAYFVYLLRMTVRKSKREPNLKGE